MKKLTIILATLLITVSCIAQKQDRWMKILDEAPEHSSLKDGNKLTEYSHLDFSKLLEPKNNFLGFIGEDYRRIKITFNSLRRNKMEKHKYAVEGTSEVGNTICNFKGSVIIKQVRVFAKLHFGVDDEYKDAGIKEEGLIVGEYIFNEDSAQNNSGTFKGSLVAFWYMDKGGLIQYDDLRSVSDSYFNNQYFGTWLSYKTHKSKICNWGESRIPFSGDLDIGTGEFFPNPKYNKVGWKDYDPRRN